VKTGGTEMAGRLAEGRQRWLEVREL